MSNMFGNTDYISHSVSPKTPEEIKHVLKQERTLLSLQVIDISTESVNCCYRRVCIWRERITYVIRQISIEERASIMKP